MQERRKRFGIPDPTEESQKRIERIKRFGLQTKENITKEDENEILNLRKERFKDQFTKDDNQNNDNDNNNNNGRQKLKDIIEKYQDKDKVDKIGAIQSDVNDVKVEVKKNIDKMVENVEDVQKLEEKANLLKDACKEYEKNADVNDVKVKLIIIIIIEEMKLLIIKLKKKMKKKRKN